MELQGITAVVTAGASGIGRAVAERLGARGGRLALVDIDRDALDAAVGALAAEGVEAAGFVCDVTSDDGVAAMAAAVLDRFGSIDLLMNHAGGSIAGPPESIPLDAWRHLYDFNVLSMVRGVQAFVPGFIAQGHGQVVLTTSSLALLGGHPLAGYAGPYVTTKAAVIGLAQSLRMYLRPQGVGVTLFAPDMTDTKFPQAITLFDGTGNESVIQATTPYGAQTPGQAADVLIAALEADRFLASATPGAEELLVRQAAAGIDPMALVDAYAG
jgi:NAD(P)-dependent dehydrogenase (short-subunit alcohol dehydrogenase family)